MSDKIDPTKKKSTIMSHSLPDLLRVGIPCRACTSPIEIFCPMLRNLYSYLKDVVDSQTDQKQWVSINENALTKSLW